MDSLLDILRINRIIVYAVYGQVFFVLGLAIALRAQESRKRSRLALAGHLPWLGAFGLTHSLNEWGNIFIPIQAIYLAPPAVLVLRVLQSLILALSFFLLMQFGILVALGDSRWRRPLRLASVAPLIAGLYMLFAAHGVPEATDLMRVEVWTRHLLALPGAALAAFGMLHQARLVEGLSSPRIARHFRLAAVSLGAYAVVAGLIVTPVDNLVGQWSSYRVAIDLFGIPVIILRSLAGLGIALGIGRGLAVFEVETTRLIEKAERRRFGAAERARLALDAVGSTVSQRLEIGDLLDAALAKVLEVTQSSVGWVMLTDQATGSLELRACRGSVGQLALGPACTPDPGCACARVADGASVVVAPADACCLWPSGVLASGFVGVSLQARERVVGTLCVAAPAEGEFESEDLGLLTSIGRQVGLAIENARLLEELRRKEEVRSHLLKQAITAQEEERRRIARELHDTTGQSLSAVIMGLGAAREALDHDTGRAGNIADETRELAVRALRDVRELIVGLRPATLEDLGLMPALRRLADNLHQRAGVEVKLRGGNLAQRLPAEVETVLFRIVQEGLNNVGRHAAARHVVLRIALAEGEIRVELTDDGVGFDVAKATARPETGRGLGLLGMQERASLLGGEVVVNSNPGDGTRLLARLPLDQPALERAGDGQDTVEKDAAQEAGK